MGRVDRLLRAIAGTNTYDVHLDFNSYLSMFIRTMKCNDAGERKVLLGQIHTVLKFLVTPDCCYHTFIEQYFEWEGRNNKEIEWVARSTKVKCGSFCSKCIGDIADFTKRVSKAGVVSFLTTKVFSAVNKPTVSAFIKAMKKHKGMLFHANDVPKGTKMGQIHALALILLARGIIGLTVTNQTKIGTEKINQDHIAVTLLNAKEGDCWMPAYFVPSQWDGMNLTCQ
jgi:hypothetical protein